MKPNQIGVRISRPFCDPFAGATRAADGGVAAGEASPTKVLLNENECAAILGLSAQSLRVWRFRGRGPKFIKIGRLVRYSTEALEEWINGNAHSSTAEYK